MDAPVQHVPDTSSVPVQQVRILLSLDRSAARQHLEALAPGEKNFTFQTFDDNEERKSPALRRILHGTLEEHAAELERLNSCGAGIYVMANAGDGAGRKAANVTAVRVLFIDTDGAPLLERYALEPTVIVETSAERFHVSWRVVDVPLNVFKHLQQGLAAIHGTDPSVNDLCRVVRLAGTYHRKREPVLVRIKNVSTKDYTSSEVFGAWPELKASSTPPQVKVQASGSVQSQVEPAIYGGDSPAQDVVRKKLSALCQKIAHLKQGSRNETLKNAARTMGGYVAHGSITEAEVEFALQKAGESCGLSAEEATSAVANGLANGKIYPLAVDLLEYRQTDYGNAERLFAAHGNSFRYVPGLGFIVWDGKKWAVDDGRLMLRLAATAARKLFDRAATINDDTREGWVKYSLSCERNNALVNAVNLVKTIPGVTVQVEQLDADTMLLNVENGTIDLRTGNLRPHDPGNYITKVAPVVYDPNAKCPKWTDFQHTICAGDDDLIAFKRRAYGYALTGSTAEHALFIGWGRGANGKSTELGTVAEILGDYATTAQFDTFAVKKNEGVRNDLADLVGARFVAASEGESGQRLAEGLVKQLTGGDPIKARFLHKEFFTYPPTFKVFLATNHKPLIRGTDEGIWRRIRLIPYSVTIPEKQRNLKLPEELAREKSGILNWLLAGCQEWQVQGLGTAEAVQAATSGYRHESDVLADFVDACCVVDELVSEGTGDLYRAYEEYAGGNGDVVYSSTIFGKMLSERGFMAKTRRDGKRVARVRSGLCLLKNSGQEDV